MTYYHILPGTLVRVYADVFEENNGYGGVGMILSAKLSSKGQAWYRVLYEDGKVLTKRSHCLYTLR